MKHHFSVLFIGLLATFSTQVALAAPPEDILNEAKGSYIFKFSPEVSNMQARAEELTTSKGKLRHVFTNVLHGFSATMSRADALAIDKNNDDVIGFVNNGLARVPGAGGSGGAKGGKNGGGKGKPTPVGQIVSWGAGEIGTAIASDGSYHAWIIDSGIDDYYNGKDLNIGEGDNFVSKGKWTTDDSNGHGTHVAGILAAIDNNTGVLGIAAGATVHPVRVLHKNLWGAVDDIIKGVDYVAGKIASYSDATKHVVNMSLTIELATNDADLVGVFNGSLANLAGIAPVAVCAGNDNADVAGYTPANSDILNMYTVASINNNLNLASDSNTSETGQIDFVAPGVGIESLKPGGGTWFWSGCSMATPHVAGILLFNQMPSKYPLDNVDYPLAGF